MDLLIRFRNKWSTPDRYFRKGVDAAEVEWDDVDLGRPFTIAGNETIIMGILADAQAADDVISFLIL